MPLIVYKSSAGSGKTTTLVNEYLKIALQNPQSFRHILAITFTNKAANEMKERVIGTLKDLSNPDKQPADSLQEVIEAIDVELPHLRNRARKLLSLILHNYDEFAISTIDSFIHRVIRTFATDVQLPQNFEVVIDDEDIIPDIIQSLYDKVGSDKELTKVLIKFVLSEADEENSYDPTSKLVSFIKRHMNEDGFQHINKLDNLNITELGVIISRLSGKIGFEKLGIIDIANNAIELCSNNNLEIKDFYQGSRGILAYFNKVSQFRVPDEKLFPSKTIQKTIDEEVWFGSKASAEVQQSISAIMSELTEYYHEMIKKIENYFFYRLIYSKIYSLALVHEIKNLFIEFTEKTGKVHISEFNKKISNEIAEQPIPFIYERLGRRYRHFLIDEFQDTSILQWYNLLPLIEESLSYGNFNMLVGDAKQAIYRFRNGEVELFANLPRLYGNDGSELSMLRQNVLQQEYKEVVLSKNWRSYPEIIKFNNDFFKKVTAYLSEKIQHIYSDIEQQLPDNDKQGGLVSLNFVDADNSEEYEERKLENIRNLIDQLKDNGYQEKDICILCRTKKNAIGIAEFLLNYEYNVVSSESLLLTNSSKVRLIIAFFKLINYSENELALAEFIYNYLAIFPEKGSFDSEVNTIRKNKKDGIGALFHHFKIDAVPSEIEMLSTYEMAEFIIQKIIFQKKADIFIQYLLDFIFESKQPLDLFLSSWEDKKGKLFIAMPKDIDAIQIMTIHKAKGLAFPAVIVDAQNVKNQNTKSEFWEDLNLPEFSDLKVGLMPLVKKIGLINRGHIYEEEAAKTELDFLNVIYVAFTRPVKALFAIGPTERTNKNDKFSKYMIGYLKEKGLWEENKLRYDFGELIYENPLKDDPDEDTIKLKEFVSSTWQDLINISTSEDVIQEALEGMSSSSYGKLIHKILSEIETEKDIPIALNSIILSGLLNIADINIIESTITSVVTHPKLQKYYREGLIIKNETELIIDNGEIVRPDRVVVDDQLLTIIDYKTGEEKEQDYEQVRNYMDVFSNIGNKNIEAKLVYIGDIVRVVDVS